MPSRTEQPPTREQIEAQAADLNARLAAIHEEDRREQEQADRRRAEAQRQFDEQFVADFSRAALEADVDQARAELDQALADDPIVQALASYLASLRRRSHGLLEHSSALARLGRPADAPQAVATELERLDEYLLPVAARIATDRVAAELAAFHARRETAGDDTTEENR